MTTTTRTMTRKTPWAAVLTALLAVLGMMFGVLTFAGPATASSDPVTECTGVANYVGFDKIELDSNIGSERTFTSGEASITVTTVKGEEGKVEATGGTWATTPYTARVVVKTGSHGDGTADGYPGYAGSWSTGGQGLSHITFCYAGTQPLPPDHHASASITCVDGWTISLSGYTDMVGEPVVVRIDGVVVDGARTIDANGALTDSGLTEFADHNQHELTVLIGDEVVAHDRTPMCQGGEAAATLTCTAGWTVNLIGYIPNREVEVLLDGVIVETGSIEPPDRVFAASGPTSFTSGTHNLIVNVERVEGPVATVGPINCAPSTNGDGGGGGTTTPTTTTTAQVFTATQPYCAVADAVAGTYTTATLTATGDSQVTADAALKTQATALTTGIVPAFGVGNNEFTGLNWTTDGQAIYANGCVVPTAETVAPIEAATVTPAPETVAPETVAVPEAATTVPAAVPAGDGSSVPQVPVGLLALLALATAAAVTSGLRVATNR